MDQYAKLLADGWTPSEARAWPFDDMRAEFERLTAERDAALALAESRPAITPQVAAVYKAADCAVQIDDISVPGARDAAIIIDSALREHARKVKP